MSLVIKIFRCFFKCNCFSASVKVSSDNSIKKIAIKCNDSSNATQESAAVAIQAIDNSLQSILTIQRFIRGCLGRKRFASYKKIAEESFQNLMLIYNSIGKVNDIPSSIFKDRNQEDASDQASQFVEVYAKNYIEKLIDNCIHKDLKSLVQINLPENHSNISDFSVLDIVGVHAILHSNQIGRRRVNKKQHPINISHLLEYGRTPYNEKLSHFPSESIKMTNRYHSRDVFLEKSHGKSLQLLDMNLKNSLSLDTINSFKKSSQEKYYLEYLNKPMMKFI